MNRCLVVGAITLVLGFFLGMIVERESQKYERAVSSIDESFMIMTYLENEDYARIKNLESLELLGALEVIRGLGWGRPSRMRISNSNSVFKEKILRNTANEYPIDHFGFENVNEVVSTFNQLLQKY